MRSAEEMLPYLTAGLAEFVQQDDPFPYPASLQHALNWLAVAMPLNGRAFPPSLTDFLALCEQPLLEWWPGTLPDPLDGRFGLLSHRQLDEQVEEYLLDWGLEPGVQVSVSKVRAIVDHRLFKDIFDNCRANPDALAKEYVAIRRYLVEHPWIRQYEPALPPEIITHRPMLLKLFERPGQRHLSESQFWVCPHCGGILSWQDGRPYCAKHRLCGALTDGYRERKPLLLNTEILILKGSLHTRVCLPGKPEIALHTWLGEVAANYPGLIAKIDLWPEVDRYDLRVEFCDGQAWAVDVKDYTNPLELARLLSRERTLPGRNAEGINWQRGFFVVPDYREMLSSGYMQQLRSSGLQLEEHIQVLPEAGFKHQVLQALKQGLASH